MREDDHDEVPVDFFCIGAAKCRTTWLANCLDDHPGIAISRVKEPDFFSKHLGVFNAHDNPSHLRDWGWYRSLWDHAPDDALHGDFSINMLPNGEDAALKVKAYAPDAKFLVSLRDPVARTYSHYIHHWGRFRHWGKIPPTFEEAIFVEPLLWRSRYAAQLAPWFRHFPDSRFHFVLDVDLDEDPLGSVQDVYQFLGVDDDFEPPSLNYRINPTKTRRGIYGSLYRTSQRLRSFGVGPVINLAKRLGVERLIDRFDWRTGKKPPMEPRTGQALRRIFAHDIERLETMIDRDLSAWLDPDKRPDASPAGPAKVRETQFQQRPRNRTQVIEEPAEAR